MFVGLIPWLVMLIATRGDGVGLTVGAILAAAVAAGSVMWARRRGLSGAFEVASCITFVAVAAVSALIPGSFVVRLGPYDRAVTAAVLAAVTFASLLFHPLTTEYTRDMVPVRRLGTRAFVRTNVACTAAVGAAASAAAATFVVGAMTHGSLVRTIFSWLAPLALALACAGYLASRWHALSESDDMTGLLHAALETPTHGDLLDISSYRIRRTTSGGADIELVQPPTDGRGRVSGG